MHNIPSENLQLARDALVGLPRPDSLARKLLKEWLNKQGVTLSPDSIDVVTLHYQMERLEDDSGHPYFHENAVVAQRMGLVEALALVVPELIPLLAAGGVAQFGLGLDQAINGKTLADKDAGVSNIAFGLLNAAPLALLPAAGPRMLFPGKSSRFVMPTRLNDQWGYPLSPFSPPRLPEEILAEFFVPAEPPVGDTRIARGPLNRATGTSPLLALKDGNEVELLYDTDNDAFILKEDANEVLPNYYQITAGTRDLYEVNPATRGASNAMRMYTLRKLDVDLQLPLSVPLVNSSQVSPLPKKILSIWVGNKSIPDELVENIASNAKRLEGTGFTYEFYLSKANPKAFMKNRAKLTAASNVQVKTLEEQPFYAAFEQTDFYHQYRQALDSNPKAY